MWEEKFVQVYGPEGGLSISHFDVESFKKKKKKKKTRHFHI